MASDLAASALPRSGCTATPRTDYAARSLAPAAYRRARPWGLKASGLHGNVGVGSGKVERVGDEKHDHPDRAEAAVPAALAPGSLEQPGDGLEKAVDGPESHPGEDALEMLADHHGDSLIQRFDFRAQHVTAPAAHGVRLLAGRVGAERHVIVALRAADLFGGNAARLEGYRDRVLDVERIEHVDGTPETMRYAHTHPADHLRPEEPESTLPGKAGAGIVRIMPVAAAVSGAEQLTKPGSWMRSRRAR